MGLISWVKNQYYNHILDNADRAFQNGDIVTAEEEYQKILDKLPDAAKLIWQLCMSLRENPREKSQSSLKK